MTAIKLPAAYDVSRYVDIQDFTKIDPRPRMMGTKATEGTTYKDPRFIEYMAGMRQIGCARLCYHFHRKANNPTTQARHFVDTVAPYIDDDTLLALDLEEGGETAAQIIAWFQYVMSVLPNNQVILYSRQLLLDSIPMTTAQRTFMKQIPIWTAGYPSNPDLYDSVPAFYVPDQDKFGPVWMWQYSEDGIVAGIQGKTDLNWMAPALLDIIGGVKPPEEEPMKYVKGITNATGGLYVRDGSPVAAKIGYLPYLTAIEGWLHDDGYIYGTFAGRDMNGNPATLTGCCASAYVDWTETTPPSSSHTVEVFIDGVLDYHKDLQ